MFNLIVVTPFRVMMLARLEAFGESRYHITVLSHFQIPRTELKVQSTP